MNRFQSLWTKAVKQPNEDQGESQEAAAEDATVKAAKAIAQKLFRHDLTEAEKKWAGPVVHYGFGGLLGTIYGALAEPVPFMTAGFGTVHGSAVWLAADEIAVPMFGLSNSPLKTPASLHVKALASHLVYGITTDLAQRVIVKL